MARKPRIHFRGAVYHVILNGLDDQTVFKVASDRRKWLALTEDGLGRFGHKLHAYCIGRNFVQMAIQVDEIPLSKIMQNLSFRYTRYFNSTHDRQGPMFHGRYKAIVIDVDPYLSDLVRYIHNTPVRRGRAASASAAKWTSHAAYIDAEKCPDWLTTSTVLSGFSKNERKARAAFSKYVDSGKNEGDRLDLLRGNQEGRILGDQRFTRRALKPAKVQVPAVTLNQLIRRVCKEEGIKESLLTNESRARRESQIRQTITYLATELNVATLTSMANRFKRDLTTMSRNQRYYREKLAEDSAMRKHVKCLKRSVLRESQ